MIQRIQTVYLIISVLLLSLLFFLPIADIALDGMIYLFDFRGISLNGTLHTNGYLVSILIGIVIILHGIAIFSYQNRIRQMRLIVFAVLLMLGLVGLFYFFTYYSYPGAQVSFKISAVFPTISIILDYLAIRAIKKDEALIRSIDRIR